MEKLYSASDMKSAFVNGASAIQFMPEQQLEKSFYIWMENYIKQCEKEEKEALDQYYIDNTHPDAQDFGRDSNNE